MSSDKDGGLLHTPVVELREVSVSYAARGRNQRLEVLKNVSLEIMPGRTVGIVGESGSGKSTLGKATLGLVTPSSGRVLFEGNPLDRKQLRGRVQLVPQDPQWSLDPRMPVARSIEEPLAILGTDRKSRARRRDLLLEQVGLSSQQGLRLPYELSGGQRQRAAIARALISDPVYVVCDEITSALDVTVQLQILNVLRDLQEVASVAVLFISHDLGAVQYVAHEVVTLREGSLERPRVGAGSGTGPEGANRTS